MSTLETELADVLMHYTNALELKERRELCAAAREWHSGARSKMKKFAQNEGYLPDGSSYQKLAFEALVVLKKLQGETKTPQRAALQKLRDWGMAMYLLDQNLRSLAVSVAELAASGVPDQYVAGVVAYALKDGRRASRAD